MAVLFTADTHWGHAKIIEYCGRPFKSVQEMDEVMIRNWNDKVGVSDSVYHLGDFVMSRKIDVVRGYRKRLNGRIILIDGSHDIPWPDSVLEPGDVRVGPMLEIHVEGTYITLCHYCLRTWPKSHYNTWHLYGHSHGKLAPIGKSWDVGVDCNGFAPLSFTEIKTIMAGRQDNPNLVKPRGNR